MKLDKKAMEFICNYTRVVKDLGAEQIVFEQDIAKSRDETSAIVALLTEGLPEFPFELLGINRINTFLARYNLVGENATFELTTRELHGKEVVTSINMKGKKVNAEYRCASPEELKIPRQINDAPMVRIQFGTEEAESFHKGLAAMGSDQISLIGDGKTVSIEMLDNTNDILKIKFSTDFEGIDTDDVDSLFTSRFSAKMFAVLLKKTTNNYFDIGKKGVAYFYLPVAKTDDLRVCLLPRV